MILKGKEINLGTKKQEDYSKMLENIKKTGSNKQCFDCGEKGTTYVVMNFGTFVCSRCSGLHRDQNFKVKGTGVSNFTEKDIQLVTKIGNDKAKAIWMGKFDAKRDKLPDPRDSEAVRKHIRAKYVDKKYYLKDPENEKKAKVKNEDSDASSDSNAEDYVKEVPKKSKMKNVEKEKDTILSKGSDNKIPSKILPISVKNNGSNAVNIAKNADLFAEFEFFDNTKNISSKNEGFILSKDPTPKVSNQWENIWSPDNTVATVKPGSSSNKNVASVFDFNLLGTSTSTTINKTVQQPLQNVNMNNQNPTLNLFDLTNQNVISQNMVDQNPSNNQSNTNQLNLQNKYLNNLSGAYNNNTNQISSVKPKKDISDLERALADPNAINLLNQNQQNSMSNQYAMNMYMNQMQMMNPQLMQNPQMMQAMMMQYMMQTGQTGQTGQMGQVGYNQMGYNQMSTQNFPSKVDTRLTDVNFAMNSNTGQSPRQVQQTVLKSTEDDKFKDIYNYSRQRVGEPHISGVQQNSPSSKTLSFNLLASPSSPKPPSTQTQTGGSAYNPFDFY